MSENDDDVKNVIKKKIKYIKCLKMLMTLKTKYESIQIAKAKYYQTKQQDPEFIERIRQKIQRVL